MILEILGVVISAVTALAAVAAAYIAKKTLNRSREEQKEGLERQKKQATIDAYNKLQEQVFDALNEYKPTKVREIAEDNQSKDFKIIGGYLARIEHFCVGLTNGIYDYETFFALAHGYFDSDRMLLPRLLPIIEKKSENSDGDYFENLHEVWRKMRELTQEKNQGDQK